MTTLAELRTAMQAARISHKKAILRADVPAVTATLTYLRALEAAYEVQMDSEGPVAAMHHDNTYQWADLNYGYHLLPAHEATTKLLAAN